MIRTLALAAAAAAVGYTVGQRAAESPESRFERDQQYSFEGDYYDRNPDWYEQGDEVIGE